MAHGAAHHLAAALRAALCRGLRPAWLLRLGLFLYDHIGGRKLLPPTKTLDMKRDPAGKPLKPLFSKAFEYSDCWVNDARLVVLNARDAADRGAVDPHPRQGRQRAPRKRSLAGRRRGRLDRRRSRRCRARLIVNAAGPWVDQVLAGAVGQNDVHNVRLVQGSHIVVPKKFDDPRAYFFQNKDGRIIFAIPYEEDFTLIGTTDHDYRGDPAKAPRSATPRSAISATPRASISPSRCAARTSSGPIPAVRPLYDDGASKAQEATRDYVLKVDGANGQAPLVNIFGGKITTYRRLAEVDAREDRGPARRARASRGRPARRCPAAISSPTGFDAEVGRLKGSYPFLDLKLARRLVRLYGTQGARAARASPNRRPISAGDFGADLYEAEVRYLMEHEWATTAEDVLWRRTKRGLRFDREEAAALDEFMTAAIEAITARRRNRLHGRRPGGAECWN